MLFELDKAQVDTICWALRAAKQTQTDQAFQDSIEELCWNLSRVRSEQRWFLYDWDSQDTLGPTFASYEEAEDELDQQLDNVIILPFLTGVVLDEDDAEFIDD